MFTVTLMHDMNKVCLRDTSDHSDVTFNCLVDVIAQNSAMLSWKTAQIFLLPLTTTKIIMSNDLISCTYISTTHK